jgi:sec-independent protein translocase protein TatB
MDLFGIGGTEFLLVVLLAAIVLGPSRLALAARELGKLIRNLKNYFKALSDDLGRELDLLEELKDVKDELKKI